MSEENKRLFICECVSSAGMSTTKNVYVIANDPYKAEQLAIEWMRNKKYGYTDYVRKVTCIASTNNYKSDNPLVA